MHELGIAQRILDIVRQHVPEFRNASVRVINKIDLLPYVDCDLGTLTRHACQVNPALTVFETSCTTRAGIPACCEWLEAQVAVARA